MLGAGHAIVGKLLPMRAVGMAVMVLLVLSWCSSVHPSFRLSLPAHDPPTRRYALYSGCGAVSSHSVRWFAASSTIDARSREWRARIAGYEVPVEHTKDEMHFALPGEAGKFRGHLNANGERVVGHWIQLGGLGFYSPSYASPVELGELAPGVWRGNVVPLDEVASFYLSIQPAPGGSLTAFFRNPEANRFRGKTFRVELRDGAVTLSWQDEVELRGTYDPQAGILSLPVLGSYPLVQFRRYDQTNALGYYPCVPWPSARYDYRKPVSG